MRRLLFENTFKLIHWFSVFSYFSLVLLICNYIHIRCFFLLQTFTCLRIFIWNASMILPWTPINASIFNKSSSNPLFNNLFEEHILACLFNLIFSGLVCIVFWKSLNNTRLTPLLFGRTFYRWNIIIVFVI